MNSTTSYINIPRPREGYQYRMDFDDVPYSIEPSPIVPPINDFKWEHATLLFEKLVNAQIGDTMLVTSNKMIGAYYYIQKIGEKTYRRCSELCSTNPPHFTYDIKDTIKPIQL